MSYQFYNSHYDDPYYNQYDGLDSLIANQGQQQAGGGGQSQSSPLGALGSMGGQQLASQMFGSGGASTGVAAPTSGIGSSAAGTSSLASVGVPAAVVLATALAGRSGLNMLKGKQKNWKDASLVDNAGRAALAMGTFGGSELVNKFVGGHKSTKQYQNDRTNELLGMSSDQKWQDAVNHFRGVEHAEGDTGKGFNSAEVLEKAKTDGKGLWGTSAVLKQFGPDWLNKYSEAQREETTRKLAQKNLFSNSKGDWQINDSKAAMSALDEVLNQKKKLSELDNLVKK